MNDDRDTLGDNDDDSVGYEQARRLRATLDAAGIDRGRLWLYYFSLGGNISDFEVDAYLHHSLSLPRIERDLLALAANELLSDMAPPQAPYASDIQDQHDSDEHDVVNGAADCNGQESTGCQLDVRGPEDAGGSDS